MRKILIGTSNKHKQKRLSKIMADKKTGRSSGMKRWPWPTRQTDFLRSGTRHGRRHFPILRPDEIRGGNLALLHYRLPSIRQPQLFRPYSRRKSTDRGLLEQTERKIHRVHEKKTDNDLIIFPATKELPSIREFFTFLHDEMQKTGEKVK
jgi:hypothetical protein